MSVRLLEKEREKRDFQGLNMLILLKFSLSFTKIRQLIGLLDQFLRFFHVFLTAIQDRRLKFSGIEIL